MTQQQTPGRNFEERLLAHLKEEVRERAATEEAFAAGVAIKQPSNRRPLHLALGAAAAVVLLTAAFALSAGGGNTPAAFAVEAQPEGAVRVEIRSLEDAKGLEDALREAGIPASVNYLAAGMTCKEPRFRQAPWPDGNSAVLIGPVKGEGPFVFLVGSDTLNPGQTLVITASGSLGAPDTQVDVADGAIAPCEPVPA